MEAVQVRLVPNLGWSVLAFLLRLICIKIGAGATFEMRTLLARLASRIFAPESIPLWH